MGICAYCGSDEKLTREHIIPAFLFRYQQENGGYEVWNETAGKMLTSEVTINDVCANCNNKLLGSLDGYANKLFKKSGVFTPNFLSNFAILMYDYSLLERWLLKVSFNSARATGNTPSIFHKHIPYMLGKQERSQDIFVLAAIHKPVKLTEEEMIKYQGQFPFDSNGLINPFFVRITRVLQSDDDFVVRAFVIGSLLFYIVLFSNQIKLNYKKTKVKKLLKLLPGMQIIKPNSRLTRLTQTTLTFLDTQKDHFYRLRTLGVL